MAEKKKALDQNPITTDESGNLGSIWDIDDAGLDTALGLSEEGDEKDPVLGTLDIDSPEDEKKSDEEPAAPELEGLDDSDEEGEEKSKTSDNKSEEEDELPELDLDDEKLSKKTPKEEDKIEASEGEDNEFAIFAKLLAEKEILDINDEDFDPSIDGLVEAFSTTIEARIKEEIDLFQRGLPNEGKELLKHMMNGGNVSNFMQAYSSPDVVNTNITGEHNIANQRTVLKEFLKLRGDSTEDIEETIQDYEDLGKLEKQAKKAQQRLTQYYEQQKKELAFKQEQENSRKEQKRQEVVSAIQDKISNNPEVKGFPLTRKAKKELLSYMTETTVKVDGPSGPQYVTQFQADEMNASQDVDDFILRAYLRMTDFNLEGVKKKSKSDLSSKLRSQLQNSKSRTSTQAKFGGNKKPNSKTKTQGVWDI